MRQIGVLIVIALFAPELWGMVPPAGASLGDLLRERYPTIGGALEGVLLVPLLAEILFVVPLLVLGWVSNPPPEHGLRAMVRWLRFRDLIARDRVENLIGGPQVAGDLVQSDFGSHAVWEVPSQNLRLVDAAGVEMAEDLWGQFLSGLTRPVAIMTHATPVDLGPLIQRLDGGRGQARSLAQWMRANFAARSLVERHHYVCISDTDEQAFADSVGEITEGIAGLGLRKELVRRLDGDELAAILASVGVYPRGPWVAHRKQLQDDRRTWHEVVALGRWPRLIRDNWLAPFVDGQYAIDVVTHIVPIDPDDIEDGLERRMGAMASTNPNVKRKTALKDLETFVEALEDASELPFDVTMLMHVHGSNRKEVATQAKRLQSRMRRSGGRAKRLPWEQAEALLAASPLAVQPLRHRTKRVDTSTIKNAYHFTASACWPEGSIPWGEALDSKRVVGWTPWAQPSISTPHLFVAAGSGGGKGFAVKIIEARLLMFGLTDECYAIDQAEEDDYLGEYGRWAAHCGVEYVRVESLAELEAAMALPEHDSGWHGRAWNIARLPMQDRPKALLMILRVLWQRAVRNPGRYRLIVDELWSFFSQNIDEDVARELHAEVENVARRGRHAHFGVDWITQRVRDALRSEIVQVIQSQAATHLYGMQRPLEITAVKRDLEWTDAEAKAIRHFVAGHFLLIAGPWSVTMRITSSDDEYAMANTDGKVSYATVQPVSLEPDPSSLDTDAAAGVADDDPDDRGPETAVHPLEPR
jgi:hypothetical protein